jgi:hypothetical protein
MMRMGGWEDGRMGGWEDGRMGGWEDGRMGGWEDGRMGETLYCYSAKKKHRHSGAKCTH